MNPNASDLRGGQSSASRSCLACVGYVHTAVTVPLNRSGSHILACTVEKAGSTSFRAVLMHAAGYWDYSQEYLQGGSTPHSIAADVSRDKGFCWAGAKKPCTKDGRNSDQLHNQFRHAFNLPNGREHVREVLELSRSASDSPATSTPIIRVAQVRHPVARFISGCTDKLLTKMDLDPGSMTSQPVAKWTDKILALLAKDLKVPTGEASEVRAWLMDGLASTEWREGGLKEAEWVTGREHMNQSYLQPAVGVAHTTSLEGVVDALALPADDETLVRLIESVNA